MRILPARLSERLARIPVIALVFALLAIQMLPPSMSHDIGFYDEGLLVTDSFNLSRGQIPYRDFYANYPPGSFLVVRALAFVSGGATIHAMRVLAFGLRATGAALAAVVVGRLTRGRARVATFAAVLLLQSQVPVIMFAYVTAMVLALAGVAALPIDTPSPRRFAASGVLFGLVSWFRHDLFVYGVAVAAFLVLLARLAGSPLIAPLPRQGRRAFTIGLLSAVLPFWCLVLLLGGPSQVVHDLVLDQAKYVQPARVMPLPSFKGEHAVDLFHWTIPVYLTDYTSLSLVVLALGIAVGAAHMAVQLRRSRVSDRRRLVVALLLALAVATAPQALQRTDFVHVGYGAPATLACLFGAFGAVPAFGEAVLMLVFVPLVVSRPELVAPREILARLKSVPDETLIPTERRTLVEAIHRLAKPDDRIFVGCTSHVRALASYVSVYYEARRLGATRIQQFDPGIVTRDDVQQRMIEELQAHHPAAVVLSDHCYWDEPNASSKKGSDRLDRYIAAHYADAEQVPGFRVMRPR